MNKVNKFSGMLITISFVIFVSSYYYLQKPNKHDLRYSKALSAIMQIFYKSPEVSELSFTTKGYTLTEERSVLITMLFCVFLLLISISINGYMLKKDKENLYYLRLSYLSFILGACIIYMIYSTRLYIYA